MTDQSNDLPPQPLGVGKIVSDAVNLLFSNFLAVFTLSVVPAFIGMLPIALNVASFDPTSSESILGPSFYTAVGFSVVLSLVGASIGIGMVVNLIYDRKMGRRDSLGGYFARVMKVFHWLVLYGLIVGLLTMVGALALILPGFYVAAMFYVVSPVILLEPGRSPMVRSMELTEDYRWALIGLLIVVWLIMLVFSLAIGLVDGLVTSVLGGLSELIVEVIVNAISYGFGGIVAALVYARLREIKEGMGIEDISRVFD